MPGARRALPFERMMACLHFDARGGTASAPARRQEGVQVSLRHYVRGGGAPMRREAKMITTPRMVPRSGGDAADAAAR